MPPKVAVTVAFELPARVAAAVALNVALFAPAATVTDAGTLSELLLLDNATTVPPVGAFPVRLTVQVLTPPGPSRPGTQATLEGKSVMAPCRTGKIYRPSTPPEFRL